MVNVSLHNRTVATSEEDSMASVCAVISGIPEGGADREVTITLSTSDDGSATGRLTKGGSEIGVMHHIIIYLSLYANRVDARVLT